MPTTRTTRKQAAQKPPPGMVFIEDYTAEDGTTTPGIASKLGVTAGTYRKWRMAGMGPATFKLGKRVAAYEAEVDAWVAGLAQAAREPKHESRPPEPRRMRRSHPVAA